MKPKAKALENNLPIVAISEEQELVVKPKRGRRPKQTNRIEHVQPVAQSLRRCPTRKAKQIN